MNQKAILYGIIGLLSGILLTILFTSSVVNSNNTGMMRMMGMRTDRMMDNDDEMMSKDMMEDHEGMSMDDMVSTLKGKTGDDFDKAFITGMIEHHQGAIDIASLAKQYAGHQEIKDLADDIVSAQTSEINMMREWQKTWGY